MTPAEQRFTALFDDHAVALRSYFRRRNAGHDTDDLTAEVYAIAWRKLDDIPGDAELPWLYRTAWNVLANHRRKAVDMPIDDVAVIGDFDVASDPADLIVERDDLRLALAALSPRDREILRLVAWEGLDTRGIAQALGVTEGSAGSAVSRARAALRAAWPA